MLAGALANGGQVSVVAVVPQIPSIRDFLFSFPFFLFVF